MTTERTITTGYPAHLGMREPQQTITVKDGYPIVIEGLNLELSVDPSGNLQIRELAGSGRLVIKAFGGNQIQVSTEFFSDWTAKS